MATKVKKKLYKVNCSEERTNILEAVKKETRRLNTTLSDFLLWRKLKEYQIADSSTP